MASKNGHVSAPQIVRRAIEQVAELTGRDIEGVNGLEKSDDGWVVTLEGVALRRSTRAASSRAPTARAATTAARWRRDRYGSRPSAVQLASARADRIVGE